MSKTSEGGRPAVEHQLTIDMAKEICMIQRTDIGKKCREYFLEIERKWNTPEAIMARALQFANNQLDAIKTQNIKLAETIEIQSQQIEEMKPAKIFADAVSVSDTSILMRDLAKLLRQNGVKVGEKRLYSWMRENGYICKFDTSPTQKAMEMGLFEVQIRTVERGDSLPVETRTTKVTGKGQQYFINKFLNENGTEIAG